jgi:hypothetical protein
MNSQIKGFEKDDKDVKDGKIKWSGNRVVALIEFATFDNKKKAMANMENLLDYLNDLLKEGDLPIQTDEGFHIAFSDKKDLKTYKF